MLKRGKKNNLRLIINVFKCSSCNLKAEEADLFSVSPRGLTDRQELYERKVFQQKFLTRELPDKCYNV